MNTYGYVIQNPVSYSDSNGLEPKSIVTRPRLGPALPIPGDPAYETLFDTILGAINAYESEQHLKEWDANIAFKASLQDIVNDLNTVENESIIIPWPPKKPGKWTCICRADANERSPDLTCEFDKYFAFGWGGATMPDAYKKAERMAKATLRASSVHHVQCKCTGPKGEQRNRSSN